MNNRYWLLLAGVLLTGCHKQEISLSKPDLLTANTWRLAAQTHTTTFGYGGPSVQDEYATMPACEKDNFLRFRPDNTVLDDEGASKCDSAAAQTQTATWTFNSDETKLRIVNTAPGSLALTFDVVELTPGTLRLRYTYSSVAGGIGATFVTDITYGAL